MHVNNIRALAFGYLGEPLHQLAVKFPFAKAAPRPSDDARSPVIADSIDQFLVTLAEIFHPAGHRDHIKTVGLLRPHDGVAAHSVSVYAGKRELQDVQNLHVVLTRSAITIRL